MDEALDALVITVEPLLEDVDAFLAENGLTDSAIMLSEKIGLNDAARLLYEKGELTIGQLLLVNPTVITKNT